MINRELYDFIKTHLRRGAAREAIKDSLKTAGWKDSAVEEAFLSIEKPDAYFAGLSRKKVRAKNIVSLIIGVIIFPLIAAIALFLILLHFPFRDAPLPDDRDLQLPQVSVAGGDNAYADLAKIQIQSSLSELNSALNRLDEEGGGAAAAGVLEKERQAIFYFDEAAGKPKFQDPEFGNPQNFSSKSLLSPLPGTVFDVSKVISLRAASLLDRGKASEALGEAVKLIELGQKIQDSQAPLGYYLAAEFAKEKGLERVQKIIAAADLSSGTFFPSPEGLERFKPNKDSFRDALKIEYYFMIDGLNSMVLEMKNQKVGTLAEELRMTYVDLSKSRFHFKINETRDLFAGLVRREINSIDKPCGFVEAVAPQKLAPSSKIRLFFTENAVGKVLYDASALSLVNLNDIVCREELLERATRLMAALGSYRREAGDWPDSLEQLKPEYIREIPDDPYGGRPLKYSKSKKVIYSVGKDLTDSGGSEGTDWHAMPDPTFKLDF